MSNEAKSGELTEQEVQRVLGLIDKLQQSGFGYLKLELGDLKLTLSKGGLEAAPAAPAAPVAVSAVTASAPASPAPAAPVAPVSVGASVDRIATTANLDGHVIPSPMMGRFYSAPQPGAPHFTQVGAEVTEESTLCIIEVMKVFSAITAGVRGVVTEILVADGDFVEYKQPLFVIKPAAAKQGSPS